ncbi:hypothetical protein CN520_24450 [Bacillus cereus]|jgi:hypothetical protein|uniref:hypothetical protein n=1 Tax=Bacillus cereus TaxID=1396 RepID=UPI000BF5D7B0|nr:hypothetical protein [Bacillus cereus]PET37893.1 hypothetical protein CN520_24450 [Bacillus cereus]PEY79071.1 hypothetical protein CN344_10515 [Bacillus cereus]PFW12852.1 hypothetical protein COL12_03090 [Bacillus cereus]PGP76264.1 hypothetical protein CN999_28095 [Bacillus cereus]
MSYKPIRFPAILLLLLLLVMTTSCNKIYKGAHKNAKAPEPSIDIMDMSRYSKTESNNLFVFEGNHSYINQVFWNESKKDNFYKKQLEVNDVNMDTVLKNKVLEPGPMFQNYKLAATFSSKAAKPAVILGQIRDEKGHTYTWKEPYKTENSLDKGLVTLPKFEGETAKVALRYIWLNEDQKCYGVVDQFIILKKQ